MLNFLGGLLPGLLLATVAAAADPKDVVVCNPCVHGSRAQPGVADDCLLPCVCTDPAKWQGADCNACVAPRVGDDCQYSDELTCSGHGAVDAAGSCACHHGWGGARCGTCAPGFKGDACQYSDAETCFSHGTVDMKGVCDCKVGWNAPRCERCDKGFAGAECAYSDEITCHGHGKATPGGACICDDHWGGGGPGDADKDEFCAKCTVPRVGDACQYSDALNCHGHGKVNPESGSCTCHPNWSGDGACGVCANGHFGKEKHDCRFTNENTCSGTGRGQVDDDGKCTCHGNFGGERCEQCKDGFVGVECLWSREETCHGHGDPMPTDGKCACDAHFDATSHCAMCVAPWVGEECKWSRLETCEDRGEPDVNNNGRCICEGNFKGDHCAECRDEWKGMMCVFSDDNDCSGHGIVDPRDGHCKQCRNGWEGKHCEICPAHRAGQDCEYSDAVDCSGRGAVRDDGTCECEPPWNGNAVCSRCAESWGGKFCQWSRVDTCHGHGTLVGKAGRGLFPSLCKCDPGFWGAHCRLTERQFQETCMIKRGGPEQCCGSLDGDIAVRAPTEKQRMTAEDRKLLASSTADRACDHVWGIWRPVVPLGALQEKHPALRDAKAISGVPEVSSKDAKGWVETSELAHVVPLTLTV